MRPILLLLCLTLAGCGTGGCLRDGSSAVSTNTITAGYTPASGMWSVGWTITFKSPPKAETVTALKAAGATNDTALVWIIPKRDKSEAQDAALEAALKEGATLTGR